MATGVASRDATEGCRSSSRSTGHERQPRAPLSGPPEQRRATHGLARREASRLGPREAEHLVFEGGEEPPFGFPRGWPVINTDIARMLGAAANPLGRHSDQVGDVLGELGGR